MATASAAPRTTTVATQLAGPWTRFLPFNQGKFGGAAILGLRAKFDAHLGHTRARYKVEFGLGGTGVHVPTFVTMPITRQQIEQL